MHFTTRWIFAAAVATLGLLSGDVVAATAPYSDDFTSNPLNSSEWTFDSNSDTQWVHDSTASHELIADDSGDRDNASGTVNFSNLGGASTNNFSVTANVSHTALPADQVKLLALQEGAGVPAMFDTNYTVVFRPGIGDMKLNERVNNNKTTIASGSWNGDASGNFTMQLDGTYSDGNLILKSTAEDDSGNALTIGATDTSGLRTGSNFGIGTRMKSDDIRFADVSVVPSPSGLAIGVVLAGSIVALRGRRCRA